MSWASFLKDRNGVERKAHREQSARREQESELGRECAHVKVGAWHLESHLGSELEKGQQSAHAEG